MTVAGAAITAFLSSLTQGVLVLNERALDEMRFWMAGSVSGRDMSVFLQVLPYMAVGLIGSMALARHITTLSMGEDIAKGLGQRTGWIKATGVGVVVLLAGSAVALAGPIGFVGLAVPHIAKAVADSTTAGFCRTPPYWALCWCCWRISALVRSSSRLRFPWAS